MSWIETKFDTRFRKILKTTLKKFQAAQTELDQFHARLSWKAVEVWVFETSSNKLHFDPTIRNVFILVGLDHGQELKLFD